MKDEAVNGVGRAGNGDYMVRATALGGRVRAFALHATTTVAELQHRHATFPAVSAALGRTAMGALLLGGAALKEEEQLLTVEVRGGGPVGRIICTANGRGEVRGLVGNPRVHAESVRPGKLNVAGVVGSNGYLSVTKHLGMREPYQGMTELMTGEIGDDLAYYLLQSEQIPSAVGVGVFVEPDGSVVAAGGFLVQLLPGLDEDELAAVEKKIGRLPHPTTLIRQGISPEGILERVFPEGYEVLDRYAVCFACPCSPERFEAAIVSLGTAEVERIIEEEELPYTEVVCHFCNEAYHFTPEKMQGILRVAS
jgi:molecular chaperone Hsp33